MSYKIQIKSFLNSDIPVLDVGELGLCTDTKELFIGTKDGNLKIASNEDIGELLNLTTSNKSNLVNAINEINASSDNNVSPKVFDDLNDVDTSTVSPNNGNVLLFKDGLWKPSSTFSGSYVLELDRWNVKNDGTNAENTTKGINNALIWAAQNGFPEVILPKGTYLIDETNTIEPQSFMTLNLNGSTLRIRDNGLTHYAVISFKNNQKFSRITNGKIEGDKDTHNYSSGGTHEGGYGIQIGSFTPPSEGGNNTRFISIDNLEILNCTGDAITVNSTFGQIFPTPTMISSSWEQGSINPTDGTLIDNPSKIRSSLKIDMNQSAIKKYGYFGLYGNGYGNLGSDITSEYYDVFFYRSDDTLLSLIKNVQFFDEVEVPNGSNYAKVVLHQSSIPESNNSLINIRVPSFPQHTYIEKCDLHHCRRQGISLSGTKHIYIRENRIHHIGGTPPQGGIDVEDGYDLNQFIYIERNNFHDNQFYDVVVVNGKAIFINENKITNTLGEGASLAINAGADEVLISNNIFKKAKVILSGDITFSNNNLYGTQVSVLGKYFNRPINLYNNLFHNCKLVVDNPIAFLVKIDSCRFFNDLDKINAFPTYPWTIELMNEPQIISNCSFEGQDIYYLTYSRASTFRAGWVFENTTFNNVKSPALFAGTYVNCIFKDVGFLGIISNNEDELRLINCKFTSQDIHNTFLSINNLKSFIMKNCYIEKPNGTIIKTQKISGEVIIKDNTIKIINDILPRPIILLESTFTGKLIVIDNNILSATNIPQIGILNTTNNSEVIIRNNILKKTNINYNGKDSMQDNIINGIIDPYYKMSSPPTSGFYPLGQKLENSHPLAGGFIGWICTKAGIANNNTWQANTSYSKNIIVHSNNKVYRCIIGGTSGETAPSHSTGTATDGNVTWEYIDERAEFKQYGAIQA